MDRVELGRTGIEVTRLGLGCWQFSGNQGLGTFWRPLEQPSMTDIVDASLRAGINWFDTAEIYGWGKSEKALSSALRTLGKHNGKDVVIATKWWPFPRRASHIGRSIDKRLQCLDGLAIDLYQVHQPFSLSTIEAEMAQMAKLVANGKVRSVGVSNFSESAMRRAHAALKKRGLAVASNQVRYSLLDRRIETNGVLETARALGISIIAYSPLEQGLLTGRFHDDRGERKRLYGPRRWMKQFKDDGVVRSRPLIEVLKRVAERHAATPAQVALQWTVRFHGDTVIAIPGASRPAQAESNAQALSFVLSDAELNEIDLASRACARGFGPGASVEPKRQGKGPSRHDVEQTSPTPRTTPR